jgi:mannan endo-1,4-beta-mannosidase
MVAMTENDSIPSLENLVSDKAAWLYFCPWYMNYLTSEQNNPVDNLVEVYKSDYCITLDELPDLKKYPIGGENGTSSTATTTKAAVTTTTAKPTATTTADKAATTTAKPTTTTTAVSTTTAKPANGKKGDANLDGRVDISDAVLVMQSLANPSKYGESGTDKNHLTAEGKLNADVVGNDGITNLDALEIQKYTLRLIEEFK